MTDDAETIDDAVTFRDRERLARTPTHEAALDCLAAGIEAALPERLIRDAVSVRDGTLRIEGVDGAGGEYDLDAYDRVVLLPGRGRRPRVRRRGRRRARPERPRDRRGDRRYGRPPDWTGADASDPSSTATIDVLPGDHPLPSERGVESARRVLDAAERAPAPTTSFSRSSPAGQRAAGRARGPHLGRRSPRAHVGAAHVGRVDRRDQRGSEALLGGERRTVGARCRPATTVTLAVSDVIGDPLDTIASGPTVPDPSTYADALAVLDRYDLDAPDSVRERLRAGADGELPETPTAGDPAFDRSAAFVVGNGRTALDAAATAAADRGYEPLVLSASVRGEAREAGTTHAAIAEECAARGSPIEPPAVLLSGGETTVTLGDAADPGTGGPNAEFAASAGLALAEGPLGTEAGAEEGTTTATATAPPSRRRERRHRRARRPDRRRRSYRGRDDARPRRRPRRPRPPRRVPTLRRRGRAPADRSDRNERQRPAGDRRGEAGWRGGT